MALHKCSNKTFLHNQRKQEVDGKRHLKINHWHIWSSYPRMRFVKPFFEHSAKDASFLLRINTKSVIFIFFIWLLWSVWLCKRNIGTCINTFHLSVVVVLREIISAGWELAGCGQIILRVASTRPQINYKTVPAVPSCPPKLSSPSHGIQLNGGSAAWGAPETVSLMQRALGISWTSHWTPLLPPGITFLI